MPAKAPQRLLRRHLDPTRVALLFALVTGVWVIVSSALLLLLEIETALPSAVGLALDLIFVLVTSCGLYWLLHSWNRARVQRLTHLYVVLSQCNQTIVRSASMQELLPQICQDAMQLGGMKLAWVGMIDDATQQIRPVASSGQGDAYLDGIVISVRADHPFGRGPVGTAARENRPVWCQNFMRDLSAAPWHERALRFEWGAVAALPLHRNGRIVGTFCLFAAVPNAFDPDERSLLEEMAQNISYALDNFDRDEARNKAEQQARNVLAMTQHFLDNLPGSAYIKDQDLRVLMASRGFQDMLGMDPQAMIGKTNEELFPPPFGAKISADDRRVLASGKTVVVNEEYDGRHFESIKFVIEDENSRPMLAGITLDITQRHLLSARQQASLEINELGTSLSEAEFLQRGMQIAERLTGSAQSFLHFVSDDQQQVELAACSEDGEQGYCAAIGASGDTLWAECIRDKKVAVYNDVTALSMRLSGQSGTPLTARWLVAPVSEEGVVRVVAGVGGKAADYDDADIVTLLLIGNDLWRTARRRRVEAALQRQLNEMTELNHRLEQTHNQLLQSEKMAAIGQLAAGVAHEINNPVSFVQSNFGTLTEYVNDLLAIDEAYAEVERQLGIQQPQVFERVHQIKDKAGHDFIVRDMRQLIGESREGLERVSRIVRDLRDFSRVGETGWQWTDLHHGLDSTINIVKSVIRNKIDIERQYGDLPPVHCIPAQLNQVYLNLLVNAAQSIEERGRIIVRTGTLNDEVWVEIEDNGGGITPEHMKHLFEPFFTTKPIGKGTGLGLSLSWGIVQRHRGKIEVRSEPGIATVFHVSMPVDPQREAA